MFEGLAGIDFTADIGPIKAKRPPGTILAFAYHAAPTDSSLYAAWRPGFGDANPLFLIYRRTQTPNKTHALSRVPSGLPPNAGGLAKPSASDLNRAQCGVDARPSRHR